MSNEKVRLVELKEQMEKLEDLAFEYECASTVEYSFVTKQKSKVEGMIRQMAENGFINDLGDSWGVSF